MQTNAFERKEKDGVVWLSCRALAEFPWIVQGFSTRLGGVSKGCFSGMNLSFSRGDCAEHVQENFRRIGRAVGFEPENLVCAQQTHTVNVRVVTEQDRGKGFAKPADYTDVDALITDRAGLVLATFYADCVPLYFVDPVRHAVGLAHAGWRGTVQKMGSVTVQAMTEQFGSRPEDLIAAIGPSIGPDCYEVGEDVITEVQRSFGGDAAYLLRPCGADPDSRNAFLDLWKANEIVLQEAGILRGHIVTAGICTCCHSNFLFSHRASHGKRGNLAAFLGIV